MIMGEELLDDLEQAGYRVVRAGMVPQLADLDSVAEMLEGLTGISGEIHSVRDVSQAEAMIRQLRRLAVLVLRLDLADVDPNR